MSLKRCIECGIETNQQGNRCVLCETRITQMRDELIYLLTVDNRWTLLQKLSKIAAHDLAALETCDIS